MNPLGVAHIQMHFHVGEYFICPLTLEPFEATQKRGGQICSTGNQASKASVLIVATLNQLYTLYREHYELDTLARKALLFHRRALLAHSDGDIRAQVGRPFPLRWQYLVTPLVSSRILSIVVMRIFQSP